MSYQSFHSFYLELVKKILKASFVGWVDVKNEKFLKVVIDGKTRPLIPFKGEITEATYEDLIDKLLGREKIKENEI